MTQSSKPILFVDDDEIDVMTVKRVFRDLEISNQLICLSNGEKALEYLKNADNEKPYLIFLDLNMPRMDGWELLEIIRTDEALRDIPIVILTTSDRQEDRDKAREFRPTIVGFLTKPSNYQEFVKLIRKQLEELGLIQLENATK